MNSNKMSDISKKKEIVNYERHVVDCSVMHTMTSKIMGSVQ